MNHIASTIFLRDGLAQAVYDDRWAPLLQALGVPQIQRATEVEWDGLTQQWVALHIPTGTIIACGTNRAAVIEREVAWLESHWISASRPHLYASRTLGRQPVNQAEAKDEENNLTQTDSHT